MADNETNGRFEELRQRWEQDPSSRIFTQLAEEYRRRGETLEAVKVLEEGLKHHPGSIAAQVSLGRCRLESGLVEPALAALEAVVRKDPTQLVAYRLLVEAYLQQGDADSARERLDIYSQLNAQDPEVEVLEERIRQLQAAPPVSPQAPVSPAPSQVEEPAVEAPPPAPPTPPAASSASGAPVSAAGSDEHATVESPVPRLEPAGSDAGQAALFRLPPASHASPNLFALVPRRLRRWQDAVDADGSGAGESSVSASSPRSAPSAPVGLGMGAATAGLQASPTPPVSGERDEGPPTAGVASPPVPAQDDLGLDDESFGELELADEDAGEDLGGEDSEAATMRLDVSQLRRGLGESQAPPPAQAPPPVQEVPPAGEPPAPGPAGDETLTLAELYRRQGHTQDAEQIFRRVLDTDPDNAVAQSGLEQISAQRRGPADISSLLGDAATPEAGISEKKAAVLRNYLELLSDGSRDDVS